ncbi:uncharacterized protein LOC103833822 [Brassica rapa]|uniref:uncharacterized protein LOC103833822 n=1 Tax=Brassica campestris TaxID=3711 RepID=UPI00142E615C|nr:uncharacterized protein LOC103833822 [Brassica rapa]
MGGFSTKKMMFQQLLTSVLLLHLLISSSSGEYRILMLFKTIFRCCCCYSGALVNSSENGVCISKRGRPYELEGKLPKPGDLNLCNASHDKTCWSASLALQNLATHGEASKDCFYFYDLLECSICHPDVGVQSERLRICASFCDRVFEACSDAYFSTSDASNQVIVPCGASNGIICVKVFKWGTNGTSFCEAVGFTVDQTADVSACYGSSISSFGPAVKSLIKTENVGWFQDLKKLVREMTLVQQFSWVVTLIVLGKMLFNRWRYQQQMRAMIQRDARRLIRYMNGRICNSNFLIE